MHTGLTIFDALIFGAAINRVLKCTWQGNMHTGTKIFDALAFGAAGVSCVHLARKYAHRCEIFDALDFGPARRKVLKCNWQKVAHGYEKI